MTDTEIIKALECFAIDKDFDERHCLGCAFEHKFCTANMSVDIAKLSLDLINRQKAKIEKLIEECGKQSTLWSKHYESIFESAKETIKAEAVNELKKQS